MQLAAPARLGHAMTGDLVVRRGLNWMKQAASRASTGSLSSSSSQRHVDFLHSVRLAKVSALQQVARQLLVLVKLTALLNQDFLHPKSVVPKPFSF